jgi:hypothetical protein
MINALASTIVARIDFVNSVANSRRFGRNSNDEDKNVLLANYRATHPRAPRRTVFAIFAHRAAH